MRTRGRSLSLSVCPLPVFTAPLAEIDANASFPFAHCPVSHSAHPHSSLCTLSSKYNTLSFVTTPYSVHFILLCFPRSPSSFAFRDEVPHHVTFLPAFGLSIAYQDPSYRGLFGHSGTKPAVSWTSVGNLQLSHCDLGFMCLLINPIQNLSYPALHHPN
ncbi:hypothetical protein B0H34DRAFT_17144 [Crassisporium funariophilum]|nr:hypothetical protein B0H34DRAFT_17144 [Crassisporium funariophilum]